MSASRQSRELIVRELTFFGFSISFGLNSKLPCSFKCMAPSSASFPERYGFAVGRERVFSSFSPNAMTFSRCGNFDMKEKHRSTERSGTLENHLEERLLPVCAAIAAEVRQWLARPRLQYGSRAHKEWGKRRLRHSCRRHLSLVDSEPLESDQ